MDKGENKEKKWQKKLLTFPLPKKFLCQKDKKRARGRIVFEIKEVFKRKEKEEQEQRDCLIFFSFLSCLF